MRIRNKKPPVNFRGSAGGSKVAKASTTMPTQRTDYTISSTPEQVRQVIESRKNQTNWMLLRLIDLGRVSTVEAYKQGILSPSACISTLKKKGYLIHTKKDWNYNGMAIYVLENPGDKS